MKISNYINGEFITTTEWIDNINPATGEVISRLPRGTSKDIQNSVEAAKNAFPVWSKTPLETRINYLEKIASAIEQKLDALALAESIDTGKPVTLAKSVDIPRAINNFRFFAAMGRTFHDETYFAGNNILTTRREPAGVAALITPWNLPLYLLTWKLAPALLMGNTVVAKPSELTPTTAHMLAEILHSVGLPKGVVNIVHGYGSDIGDTLTSHPDVRIISFTGGTATGARISQQSSRHFKKVSLELGGKNPSVVFGDCNLPLTIKGVTRSAFLNQGQICLCGSRLLIHKSIADELIEGMKKEIATWKIGNPQSEDTQFGSLISAQHREKVEEYVQIAKTNGGQIIFGGKRPKLTGLFERGAFYEPTLIMNQKPDCPSVKEEIFGPVVTVQTFETEAQAIELANDTNYGLSASVWTKDLDRATRVSSQIRAGTVWINSWLVRDLRVPFGGMKSSGLGREGAYHSLDFFSEAKTIGTFVNPLPEETLL